MHRGQLNLQRDYKEPKRAKSVIAVNEREIKSLNEMKKAGRQAGKKSHEINPEPLVLQHSVRDIFQVFLPTNAIASRSKLKDDFLLVSTKAHSMPRALCNCLARNK